jgi:CRISPR/Cas system-associated endonuclease Cas1
MATALERDEARSKNEKYIKSVRVLSTTLPRETANANLRVSQYEKYLDDGFRRKVARAILDEKIKKSLDPLSKLSEYYPSLDKNSIVKSFEVSR